jgi:protein SCO1/2
VTARAATTCLLAAALALAGCAAGSTPQPPRGAAAVVDSGPDDGWGGALLDDPYALPELTFTDTGGETYSLAQDPARPVTLVFFGYTHCPDVCNTVLADVASALRRADPAVREATELVFITTDPARDTPEQIRDYLDRFDPAFVGLTAALPTIEAAAADLGVALGGTQELPGGGYEVGHGAQVIGFGPDRAGRLVWTVGTPVGDLRADITRLATSGG